MAALAAAEAAIRKALDIATKRVSVTTGKVQHA